MKRRDVLALAAASVGGVVAGAGTGPAAWAAPAPLTVPGDTFHPESITAAPNGDLYVASIVTGEIVRFPARTRVAETFVPAGVNLGTAGILVDPLRRVLWACAIDLSFQTPTELRAFDLATGALVASYTVPDRGVCADLAIAYGAVYVTDTTDPTADPRLPGRILRLVTPDPCRATGGALTVWSADPAFTSGPGGLQVNGIAFDGQATFYTTNYSTGQLIRVGLRRDGSPTAATEIPLATPFVNPDGIRMLDRTHLLVTENPGRLSLVDVTTAEVTLVTGAVDQPTSVVRVGRYLWVAEGQVLRLQTGQPPNLPFTIRPVPVPAV